MMRTPMDMCGTFSRPSEHARCAIQHASGSLRHTADCNQPVTSICTRASESAGQRCLVASMLLFCTMQLEQDLSNPAAPLNAAATYEDVLAMLRNTAIRWVKQGVLLLLCFALAVACHRSVPACPNMEAAHLLFLLPLAGGPLILWLSMRDASQLTCTSTKVNNLTYGWNLCILLQQQGPCAAGHAVRAAL
jgi:hypothetical protein